MVNVTYAPDLVLTALHIDCVVYDAAEVDDARAEVERRHAEALDAIKATHEAAMAAAGRSHAEALEKVRAQLAAVQEKAEPCVWRADDVGAYHPSPPVVLARDAPRPSRTLPVGVLPLLRQAALTLTPTRGRMFK